MDVNTVPDAVVLRLDRLEDGQWVPGTPWAVDGPAEQDRMPFAYAGSIRSWLRGAMPGDSMILGRGFNRVVRLTGEALA